MKSNTNYSYGYSILFVGDAKVGKTSLIVKICDNIFHEKYVQTNEYSDRCKDFNFGNYNCPEIRFKFCDSPGNPDKKKSNYMEKQSVDAIIFVFDLTSKSSYKKVKSLIEEQMKMEISENKRKFKMILANKADLENQRKVKAKELQVICQTYKIIILETSAKTHLRLDEFICGLSQHLLKLKEPRIISASDADTIFSNNSIFPNQLFTDINQKTISPFSTKQDDQITVYEVSLVYGSQKVKKKITGDLKIGTLVEPTKTTFGIPSNRKVDLTDASGGTINPFLPLSSLGPKPILFVKVWNSNSNSNQRILNIIQSNGFNLPFPVEGNIKIFDLKKLLCYNLKYSFESISLLLDGLELKDEQLISEISTNNINLAFNDHSKANKERSKDSIKAKEKLYPSLSDPKVSVLLNEEQFPQKNNFKINPILENINAEKEIVNQNNPQLIPNNLIPPVFYNIQNNPSVNNPMQNNQLGNITSINKSSRFVIQNLIQEKEKRLEDNYNCPICHVTLSNPVNLEDGYTYDKECLEKWFQKSNYSPMTGQKIVNKNPPPNIFAKATIQERMEEIQTLKNTLKEYK